MGHSAGLPRGREAESYLHELRDTDARGGDMATCQPGSLSYNTSAAGLKVCGGIEAVKSRCVDTWCDACAGFVMEPGGRCGYMKSSVAALVPRSGWTTYVVRPTPP